MTIFTSYPISLLINFTLALYILRFIVSYRTNWLRILIISGLFCLTARWIFTFIINKFENDHSISNTYLDKIIIAILVYSWVIAIEISVLIILEIIQPSHSTTELLLSFASLPRKIRITRRMIQLCAIALRYGLIPYLRGGNNKDHQEIAIYLRESLQEGGLIFIKLGQFLAGRPDIIPTAYVEELSKLQTEVKPEPWDKVEQTLIKSWGAPIHEKIAYIDTTPVGSASVAQVHLGRLHSGSEIAIKVQRSTAAAILAIDGETIRHFGRFLSRRAQWAQQLNIIDLCDGFVQNLNDELDQTVELQNLRSMRQIIRSHKPQNILVPGDVPELSGKLVLVMEKLDGIPLSRAKKTLDKLPTYDREKLATELIDITLSLLFRYGVFHADLHAGNILITPNGKLGLLDFGMIGRIDKPTRNNLLLFMAAVQQQDSYTATRILLKLAQVISTDEEQEVNEQLLQEKLGSLIMKYSNGLGAYSGKSVFTDLMPITKVFRLSVSSDLSYAFRCIDTLEGAIITLAPSLESLSAIRRSSVRILEKSFSIKQIAEKIIYETAVLLPLLERLPQRIDRITSDIEQGNLKVKMNILETPSERKFINRLTRQFGVILLGIASLISGVLMVISHTGPTFFHDFTIHAIIGYVFILIGFVLSMRILASSFRSELKYRKKI